MTAGRLIVLVLPLCACLAACKGKGYWLDRLQADPLYQRSQSLRQGARCSGLVPLEFGSTLPVPVRDAAHGHFEVLFFPAAFSPSEYTVMTPTVQGWFALGTDSADRCERIGKGEVQSLGPGLPKALSMAQYYRTEARLFADLQLASALYFKGAAPAAQDREALKEFAAAFDVLAAPGLVPYYYRLSPDFWEWLRLSTGRSIPKPQPSPS